LPCRIINDDNERRPRETAPEIRVQQRGKERKKDREGKRERERYKEKK